MALEAWHRRQAIQIAAALPDESGDALIVLDLARDLVEGFLSGDHPVERERVRGAVVSLSSATKGTKR